MKLSMHGLFVLGGGVGAAYGQELDFSAQHRILDTVQNAYMDAFIKKPDGSAPLPGEVYEGNYFYQDSNGDVAGMVGQVMCTIQVPSSSPSSSPSSMPSTMPSSSPS
eukprot:CAMPEP_0194363376 /NCGR_PEP_ID=MMETSP0174-20130528/11174_1 /TAXON_ID=216777 /ORGANISM="Proboscia alata, Strain PI-D3" /LENGTH=106 /DNA_ID=CAMNT_0039136739 /DNA_START=50 /DNA_END=366 /DNA_ORIENTATION=+